MEAIKKITDIKKALIKPPAKAIEQKYLKSLCDKTTDSRSKTAPYISQYLIKKIGAIGIEKLTTEDSTVGWLIILPPGVGWDTMWYESEPPFPTLS